jgi:hypothetical protein
MHTSTSSSSLAVSGVKSVGDGIDSGAVIEEVDVRLERRFESFTAHAKPWK